VPEVLVAGDRYSLTRPRQSYDDMLAKERLPEWL
jgi:diaminopimelate decarboxylase